MKISIDRLIFSIAITGLMFTSIACSKNRLDVINPNQVTDSKYWKSEADALAGLYGIYDAFQTNQFTGKLYREFDNVSDNAITISGANWAEIESSFHTPITGRVLNAWTAYYTVVNRANLVIDRVTAMEAGTISDESRKRILAEAFFLKAYVYLDLTTLWGNVPLYDHSLSTFDNGNAASDKADIVAAMVLGLKDNVIPNLPVNIPATEKGRIGRGAAVALLGKYYLFNNDYSNAATTLADLMTAPYTYNLYPKYDELFTQTGEFSKESLFEINFESGGIDNGESFSIRIDTNVTPLVPQAYWRPTDQLVNSYLCTDGKPIANSTMYGAASPLYNASNPFTNRDPRFRATVFTNLDNTPGGKKVWAYTNNIKFAPKKYSMITSTQYNGGPQNYYMIRYAEVLLMYAEAQNEAVGADASVYTAINKVRARAGMPDCPAGLNKDVMRSYIRDERRWEFALEHQRYFDILRWRIADQVIPPVGGVKAFTNPRDYLWPYPQNEMDNNPALKSQGQNTGWQ